MRIGVVIVPTDPFPVAVAQARRVEALGFDHLWTYDHLSWQHYREEPWFAALPWLTGIAAATDRIRIGTMVCSPNFREPLTLAKDAIALDHVSEGRAVLGVGAGGVGFDATVYGGEPLSGAARATRFAEMIEALDGLLTHHAYSYAGEHYTIADARTAPGPLQQPRLPLAVAASGPRALALGGALRRRVDHDRRSVARRLGRGVRARGPRPVTPARRGVRRDRAGPGVDRSDLPQRRG